MFVAILLPAFVLSAGAEDFIWSWEKDPLVPSERLQPDSSSKPAEIQPCTGVAAPVQKTVEMLPGPAQPAIVKSNSSEFIQGPAVMIPNEARVVANGGSFAWNWEDKGTNGGQALKEEAVDRSGGGRSAGTEFSLRQDGKQGLPSEGRRLEGGDSDASNPVGALKRDTGPGADFGAAVVANRTNPPSSPVVVSRVAELSLPARRQLVSSVFVQAAGNAVTGSPQTDQQPAVAGGIDIKAYDELIRENLDLRRKIEQGRQDKDLVRLENQRLARDVKDLEQKIAYSVGKIKEIGKQKEFSSGSPVELRILEDRLNKVEQEKLLLGKQLDDLQKKIAEQPKNQPSRAMETVVDRPLETVKPGSDLYKKIEGENMFLRQKLVEIDAERQKAVRAREEAEKRDGILAEDARRAIENQRLIKDELEEARAAEKKQKKIMTDLTERIPDMEKELAGLQKKISEKDATLKEKENNLEVLAIEIQQRENRIRKAEKMVELMDQAQKDISQVSDIEKRDMYYNMAAVYSQSGRYRDAEREYLHALRLDPADADVHYNLGILYDENLKEKQKAAMHYRRYLKLKPGGTDVEAVKAWLLNIDIKN